MVGAEAQSRTKRKKTENFEEAMKRLEQIVEKLEKGDMPLEQAIEAFTEGVGLVRLCHEKLEEAEKKVQKLVQGEDGRWITTPLDKPLQNNES
ncbi:exodeoxyribonuclease VII small subunit [Desulfosoma caldarium]|uniref:Exodeoxyribonuclease 7 small subunit n=1 Tax=Desulfosoma caldarium TaxID=610254 RepID=A0A3N1UPW9_9BACT|nr:exodeoxyribonuclease VII small subunit [Desulfosoma caldarium]ROQ90800.1 exodeoxyribonuclease VII small subunit [Desulfosoma caldarium]